MKFKSLTALCAIILAVLLCLSGCKNTDEPDSSHSADATSTEQEEQSVLFIKNMTTDYVIIYPEDADEDVLGAVDNLKSILKTFYKVDIEAQKDSENPDETSNHEILIGRTNRSESDAVCAEMKYSDWAVEIVSGKIVIAGATGKGTSDAMNYFLINTISAFSNSDPTATVTIDKNYSYRSNADYPLKSITVGDTEISEFSIVVSRDASDAVIQLALNVREVIGTACGAVLEISNDRSAVTDHEIIIGDTMRKLSLDYYKTQPDVSSFSYHVSNGSVIFVIGGDRAATQISAHFEQEVKKSEELFDMSSLDGYTFTQDIDPDETARYEGTDLRIMTNNILFTWSAEPTERAKYLSKIYHAYLPDILCLQEVDSKWYDCLPGLIADEYALVDAYPPTGTSVRNNLNPIFYRKDKFEVLEKDCYTTIEEFKSEVTYAVLRDTSNGKIYIVYSLHLLVDSLSSTAEQQRQNSINIVLNKIEELKATYNTEYVFVMGDFNAIETTGTYKIITDKMSDSKYIAEIRSNTTLNTGHSLGSMPTEVSSGPRNYDYIIVNSDSTRVMTHDIITSQYALDASDHCPVYIDIILK